MGLDVVTPGGEVVAVVAPRLLEMPGEGRQLRIGSKAVVAVLELDPRDEHGRRRRVHGERESGTEARGFTRRWLGRA